MVDFTDPLVRGKAQQQVSQLMADAFSLISIGLPGAEAFYNERTHRFLMKHAWEIIIPASDSEIPPVLREIDFSKEMSWPYMTTYSYVSAAVYGNPPVPWLAICFGYAVVENKLVRTTFFTHQKLVAYQPMPQGIAIDPLAKAKGIQPEYYIGMPVCSKNYLTDFLNIKKGNPFEIYVDKEGHLMK